LRFATEDADKNSTNDDDYDHDEKTSSTSRYSHHEHHACFQFCFYSHTSIVSEFVVTNSHTV